MDSSECKEFLFKMDLMFEKKRLESFNNKWIFDDSKPCNAKKLAEAGFYYTGNEEEPDFVKCFLCEKELVGWEETDDPWQEHLNRSPQCEFVKLNKLEIELTLAQFVDLRENLIRKLLDNFLAQKRGYIECIFDLIKDLKRTIVN